MVVVDTNVLDCLLHAMRYGDFPRTNDPDVRAEQVATFRLFLWAGLGAVGRVPVNEVSNHPHEDKKEWLQRIIFNQLLEVWVQDEDKGRGNARTAELTKYHNGKLDCQLVAEAEIVGASTLLSYDKKMIRNLRPHTTVDLLFPTEYWRRLDIPRGTPPKWTPAPSNPLAAATFWRWDQRGSNRYPTIPIASRAATLTGGTLIRVLAFRARISVEDFNGQVA